MCNSNVPSIVCPRFYAAAADTEMGTESFPRSANRTAQLLHDAPNVTATTGFMLGKGSSVSIDFPGQYEQHVGSRHGWRLILNY